MQLSQLTFDNFNWVYNPEYLTIKDIGNDSLTTIVDGVEVEKTNDTSYKVITGVGTFYGSDCLTKYMNLQSKVKLYKGATLILPTGEIIRALLTKLDAKFLPKYDYIDYEFEFKQV